MEVCRSTVDVNRGIVHYFKTHNRTYSLHSLIKAPMEMNSNFGSAVSVHDKTMLVAANGYGNASILCNLNLVDTYCTDHDR